MDLLWPYKLMYLIQLACGTVYELQYFLAPHILPNLLLGLFRAKTATTDFQNLLWRQCCKDFRCCQLGSHHWWDNTSTDNARRSILHKRLHHQDGSYSQIDGRWENLFELPKFLRLSEKISNYFCCRSRYLPEDHDCWEGNCEEISSRGSSTYQT